MDLSTDASRNNGPTNIIYLDESMEANAHILSALAVPAHSWKRNLDAIISLRREIKGKYGVFTDKEIHTSEFLGGRGRYSQRYLSKEERAKIYSRMLQGVTNLESVALFNAISSKKQVNIAFECLLNTFQQHQEITNGQFLIVSDVGQEYLYPRICRLRRRYNPVPNRDSQSYQNQPVNRLVEDPIFVRSDSSYFVQLVDMVAYALLRKERAHPSGMDPYGIGTMFEAILGGICVRGEISNDEFGIIRVPYRT